MDMMDVPPFCPVPALLVSLPSLSSTSVTLYLNKVMKRSKIRELVQNKSKTCQKPGQDLSKANPGR
jgi:hypothetical protein